MKGYGQMNDTVTHEPPCRYLRDADVLLSGGELGVCLAVAVEALPAMERKKSWRRRRLSVHPAPECYSWLLATSPIRVSVSGHSSRV